MKRILAAVMIAAASLAGAQSYTGSETPSAVPISGPLRSTWVPEAGDVRMLDVDDLDGAFVKTVTEASGTVTVTYQEGDNSPGTLTFTVGGGSADGVLTSAVWDATSKVITLTTSVGGPYTVTLAELLDQAGADARVNAVAADACVDLSYSGSTLTCTQLDGGTDDVIIATTGTTDGVASAVDLTVSSGTLSIQIDRTEGGSITSSVALPSGGGVADGVVDGGSVSGTDLTLTRSEGADVVITGLPSAPSPDGVIEDVDLSFALNVLNIEIDRTVGIDLSSSVPLPIPNVVANPMTSPLNVLQEMTLDGMDYVVGNVMTAVDLTVASGVLSIEIDRVFGDHLVAGVTLPSGGGGTTVVPNPGGSPSATLSTVTIDATDYTVGAGGGGLDEAAVDVRVNVVAADACVNLEYAGSTLTCTQLDGSTDQVTISTTGTTDGVVDGGSVSGTTLILTRTEGGNVMIPGLPSNTGPQGPAGVAGMDGPAGPAGAAGAAGADGSDSPADGVVTSGTVTGTTLTLERSVGSNVQITGIGGGTGTFDGVVTGVAADTATHTITLMRSESLDDLTADLPFEVVVPDGTTGILRAATVTDFDDRRIAVDHQNIRVATRVGGPTSGMATYTTFHRTGFRGTFPFAASVPNPMENDTVYTTHDGLWCQYLSGRWQCGHGTPSQWRGAFHTEAEATQHVIGLGDVMYWQGAGDPQQVSTFTPGVYSYEWHPEPERQILIDRPELPRPVAADVGLVPKVVSAGVYELAADSGGTIVVANPGTGSILLSNITIGAEDYALPFQVTANPSGTHAPLTGLDISGSEYSVPEEVIFVPREDVILTLAPNTYRFDNTLTPQPGHIYFFSPKAINDGPVHIVINGTSYGFLKAGEGGGEEAFEGGELGLDIPVLAAYDGSGFNWIGATLGSAAIRDVGIDPGELVPLGPDGRFPPDVLVLDGVVDAVGFNDGLLTLTRTAGLSPLTATGFSTFPEPNPSNSYSELRYDPVADTVGWQQGVNRGAWQADETYNRDDVVHRQVGTELDHWIASATSFNVTPAPGASEWSPLTSNVDVRISPTTGEVFTRGSIISAGAHYWLRTGDNTTEQPTSDPTGWITLDDLQNAAEVATDTSNFNGVLAPGNNSVQSALDVLDDAVNANSQTNLTDATLLEYQINPLATTGSRHSPLRYTGNAYVAQSQITIYRARIRLNTFGGFAGTAEFHEGWIGEIFRASGNIRRNVIHGPLRNISAGDQEYVNILSVPLNHEDPQIVEMLWANGYSLEIDDAFTIMVGLGANGRDWLVDISGMAENSHVGVSNYPHSTIENIARTRTTDSHLLFGTPVFHSTTRAAFMEIDYTVPGSGVMTVREDGSEVFHGSVDLNFIGAFDVTANTSLNRADIELDFSNLPEATSNTIADHDRLIIEDVSDSNLLEHLTVGSFVDSIADDQGIVAGGGKLSVSMTGLPMEELTAMTAADIHDADTLLIGDMSASDTVSISMGTLEERLRGEYVSDVNLGIVSAESTTVAPSRRAVAQAVAAGGGGGGTADGVVQSAALAVVGLDLSLTLGRSIGAEVTASVTLPAAAARDGVLDAASMAFSGRSLQLTLGRSIGNDIFTSIPILADEYVDTLGATVTGTDLLITLGRAEGADLTATAVLPAGGSGTELDIAALDELSSTGIVSHDLLVAADVSDGNANKRITLGSVVAHVADGTTIRSNDSQLSADVVDTLDATVVGSELTVTLGRTESADLVDTVTLPGPFEGAVSTTNLNPDDQFLLFDPGRDLNETITGNELLRALQREVGPFDNMRTYILGDIAETGLGDDTVFWIASALINAGRGAPTLAAPSLWWNLASHGFWREELDPTQTYDFFDGDSYHIGDEAFIVTADVTGVTGDALRTGEHILEISNFSISDEGVEVSDNTESLNFTGDAITCTGDRDVICDVTGGTVAGTDAEIENVLWATFTVTSTTGGSWSLSSTGTALGFTGGTGNLGSNTEAGTLRLPLIQPAGYLSSIYVDAVTAADVVTSTSQIQWAEKARHFQFTGRSLIGTNDVRYGLQAGYNNTFQADFWRLGLTDVTSGTIGDSIRIYGRRLTGGGGMGGGSDDGVVTALSYIGGTLTLGRSVGASLILDRFPFSGLTQDLGDNLNVADQWLFLNQGTFPAEVQFRTTSQLRGDMQVQIQGLPEQTVNNLSDVDVMLVENISDASPKRKLTMESLGDFLADGVTITAASGVLSAVAGGGTALDIAGLPNQPSSDIADSDVMVLEDVSDSNSKKKFALGALATRLADGSSITSDAGTLSAEIEDWAHTGENGQTPILRGGTGSSTEGGARINLGLENACIDIGYVGSIFTCTQADGGTETVTITTTGLDIAGLTNQPSNDIADADVMVLEDVSATNTQKRFTLGALAARLADGSSITSDAGTLTAEIEDWAHTGENGQAPILRGGTGSSTEAGARINLGLNNACIDIGYAGTTFTCTQADGGTETVTITPSGESFDLHDDVGTARGTLNGSDRVLVSAENISGDPNRYVTLTEIYDSIQDIVTDNNPNPNSIDRFYVSRENELGDPLKYMTMGQLAAKLADGITITSNSSSELSAVPGGSDADGVVDAASYTGGTLTLERSVGANIVATGLTEPFDLHDDVGSARGTLNGSDRVLIAAENISGDPNRYATLTALYDGIQDIVTDNNSNPSSIDRFYVSRESHLGDPLQYVTMGQLAGELADADGVVDTLSMSGGTLTLGRTVGDDLRLTNVPFMGVPNEAGTPEDDDRWLLLHTTPLSVRYRTTTQMQDHFGFDLHDDVSTNNSAPDPLDRLVSSDESQAGDPNEWLTIRDVLDEMADSASTKQATPANNDRFFLADVSEGGRPLRYIEKSELQTSLVTQQSVAHALFGTLREVDIDEPEGTPRPFAGTGFVGWSGRTLIFISLGDHTDEVGQHSEQATFTIFVDELLEVAESTVGAVPIILTGPTRNALAIHFVDRGNTSTVHLARFGRSNTGELLITADDTTTGGFYPFRAIAQ